MLEIAARDQWFGHELEQEPGEPSDYLVDCASDHRSRNASSHISEQWPSQGRLVRVTPSKLYLVDADMGHAHAAIAFEGVDSQFEQWLRTIDPTLGIEALLWDADSHGLDLEVAGVVIRRLSELGALGRQSEMRANRPMRVALVGNISEAYAEEFSEWNLAFFTPWCRSDSPWEQARSWDLVSELVDQVVEFEADLVILVASSIVLDALDLAFLRNLRNRQIPHLPVCVSSAHAYIGPFVDFDESAIVTGPGTRVGSSTVLGLCCDCLAQAQLQADSDWAHLLAHLVFVGEGNMARDMVRVAMAEASRWATGWWCRNEQIAELYSMQRVTSRHNLNWELVPVGLSERCSHQMALGGSSRGTRVATEITGS